ncbi:CcoQ/FixQ family Cbb3-type cytochrome c oxidase assembly chaperone [Moraxella nonliquefaciens]|jgi:cbb3-type cytochrome c oxidase subunit ccoQ|uniref:Cytochrome C n=1 Tax=Moraxella nonliquefaciens TaxID=478 RepID=A0A1B8QSC1_MORNO|nr:CcoQ/FixQ family Cbb3-type cytochrome c oxidase assembly chaperone [Moraxella nonliquefaciens]MCG7412124.1 CcoQ/FixQ family Cbb3-type cytochrome c oxidase assembly chaperone [Moraxella nonliquefaciens]MDI4498232.1 CcoQ/FixQ family Cbb3-type cytochrome c oxidase assembly chaperone [Moraxella nonliquefaciens]MDI4499996.1 CcoQ/FixQ family Cbb3-type cytochrome c oxidase assembly chaperone [Moraxella nonliquefaciens]OBX47606.1 cytochrome C [Moraxella nonliquefaciens]OBX51804.1 cytochrome C [Mora
MNWGVLHSIATVVAFFAFIGVAWWAYSPKNKKRFEEDAQLALDDNQIEKLPSQRTKDIQ